MATYYVDKTTGSDSDTGLSEALAWQNVSKVNIASFSGDDFVLFKCGEIWRETLSLPSSGSSGHPITFGKYSTGANPIISGSNLITGWTLDGGVANCWNAADTTQPTVVFFDSVRGTLVANKASITAPGHWFWTANVLSVYSTTDADTAFTAPGVEAGTRPNPVQTTNRTWITFDGLTIRDGNGNFANINVGSTTVTGVVFQNCTIERSGGDGLNLKGSSAADSITVDNCTIQNNGSWGIIVSNAYTTGTISNNIITGNGINSVLHAQQYSGIQGLLGNLNIFGNTIFANVINGSGGVGFSHGIYGLATTAVASIHDNTIYDNPMGAGIKAVGSANIYKNVIYGNASAGITPSGNGATNVVYDIYQNIIYGNNTGEVSAGIAELQKGAGTMSLTIRNNTIWKNGGATQQEIKITDNVTALVMKNNIVVATDTRRTMEIVVTQSAATIDNNLLWRADGNPNLSYNAANKTWAEWQALGFDTNGVNLDPLLVNPPTSFKLQAASPAINEGVDVSLTTDFIGVAIPQGPTPDIGAYEYIFTGASPVMF